MRRRYKESASGRAAHCDLRPVSIRAIGGGRGRAESRGTAGHCETPDASRSARGGAGNHRYAKIAAVRRILSASGDVPPGAGSTRVKRLRLGVVIFGVLVILAFAASSAYDAWVSYRYARAATEREIGNTANALAEQTAWILRAVDLLLLDTARWYSSDGREIPAEQLNAALAIRTAAVQQVRQVRIVDSRGNPLYWSRESSAPTLNVSDRSYFIAQRDGTAQGMFMSEPLVTRSEGRAGVTFSRRLDDENGHFAGVVTALVDLDDLNQFYRAVNVGMGSAVQ